MPMNQNFDNFLTDKMDFHAAMETFAEAWVAANTQTAINTDGQVKQASLEELPTQLPRDHLQVTKTTPTKHPPPAPSELSPNSATGGTRSLPIHCVIEQTTGSPAFDNTTGEKSTHNSVELDSYAILPGTTLLSESVRAALIKLGYNPTEVLGAKGAIQIKNWKPLVFDRITDDKGATLDDILGELTQVATLRIRISSATKLTSAEEVKEKLLQLLLSQSQSLLANAGCPIDKTLSTNGQTMSTISPEMRRAFDRWYDEQLKSYTDRNGTGLAGGMSLASAAKELLAVQQERFNMAAIGASHRDGIIIKGQEKAKSLSPTSQTSPPTPRPMASSTPTEGFPSSHPAFQHFLPGKTRMRTSFDPEHEIPRLQKWFVDNQHPSREQMLHYLSELNSLDSRKGRRPLDLTNIIYWFKNARAAHRRAAKSSEEDSFEIEEEKDLPMPTNESMPFLPNRNAVYMVPYPHYPHMSLTSALGHTDLHSRFNGQSHDREPCDLSMNGRSSMRESPSSSSHTDARHTVSPGGIDEHDGGDGGTSKPDHKSEDITEGQSGSQDKDKNTEGIEGISQSNSSPEHNKEVQEEREDSIKESKTEETKNTVVENMKRETFEVSDMPTDLTTEKAVEVPGRYGMPKDLSLDKPNDLTINKNTDNDKPSDLSCNKPKDLTNGKRAYESDDDIESDYEDDRSIDGSVSSHDEGKMTSLRDSYLSVARGLNFNPVTSSPSGQPLHIPQFPHPLAMHYFPLNTHLYPQQANQMKYHPSSQPTTPKTSPGHGQENNSHRKRRTRVFIDPLSEIPKLEKWFLDDTHPSSYMIDKYCEELNSSEYRQKFPKLEPKNVQLWFKNHRAKVKRMRLGTVGDSIMFN